MPDDKSVLERETNLQGMGASRLRKEDARFIRGRGTYVDDIKLPGMLFGALVRSPYAHARIKSINKAKALAVPGVTRAWAAPEQGTGTITIRFLMDDLRASDDGWPTPADVETVAAYIDSVRPVTVKDCYVLAPIKEFIDITIANLVPNTPEVQAAIEQSVRDMLFAKASPGQTIYAAWVSYAIMEAAGVQSFQLVTTDDYVMPSLGHMAVLSTILYQ